MSKVKPGAICLAVSLLLPAAAVGDLRPVATTDCAAALHAASRLVRSERTVVRVYGKWMDYWIVRTIDTKTGGYSGYFGINRSGELETSKDAGYVATLLNSQFSLQLSRKGTKVVCRTQRSN